MVGARRLAGGVDNSIAFDVSNDGSVVVGFGTTAQGSEAFVWTASQGMRSLEDVLLSAGVNAVQDWRLTRSNRHTRPTGLV
jgi:probable HAF family extracellular repeat protein